MSDELDPSQIKTSGSVLPSHRRILVIMAWLGCFGAIAGGVFVSASFAAGILVGTGLAFVNYFWLRASLQKNFAAALEGEWPRMMAGKYFVRYLVMSLAIAVIYVAGWVSISALILGMAGFGFATVIEGFLRIFSGMFSTKDI